MGANWTWVCAGPQPAQAKFQALRASAAVPYSTIVAYVGAHREQHPAHGPGLVPHAAVQARRQA